MRETIIGTLKCHRYTNHHRGGSILARLLLDQLQPLPVTELWVIESLIEFRGKSALQFRTRRGKLPPVLDRAWEGHRVVVRANVDRWRNGLGGYISRVVLADDPLTEVRLATN